MMTMMTLEPLLAVAIVIGAVHVRLAAAGRRPRRLGRTATAGFPLAGILMLGVAVFAFQAFVGRVPFDIAEAETEIMEGPLMEYSGPEAGAVQVRADGQAGRLQRACSSRSSVPWGSGLPFPLSLVVFLAKVFVLVLLVTLVAATHARYRIDQAIRYYAGGSWWRLAGGACCLALYGLLRKWGHASCRS